MRSPRAFIRSIENAAGPVCGGNSAHILDVSKAYKERHALYARDSSYLDFIWKMYQIVACDSRRKGENRGE